MSGTQGAINLTGQSKRIKAFLTAIQRRFGPSTAVALPQDVLTAAGSKSPKTDDWVTVTVRYDHAEDVLERLRKAATAWGLTIENPHHVAPPPERYFHVIVARDIRETAVIPVRADDAQSAQRGATTREAGRRFNHLFAREEPGRNVTHQVRNPASDVTQVDQCVVGDDAHWGGAKPSAG